MCVWNREELPSLVEGSIYTNLTLAVDPNSHRNGRGPSEGVVWVVAQACGLSGHWLQVVRTRQGPVRLGKLVDVGMGGRNLMATDRQSICIARSLLAQPDVLLMHKPTALLAREKAALVLQTLHAFARGGLPAVCEALPSLSRCRSTVPLPTPTRAESGTVEGEVASRMRTVVVTLNAGDEAVPPECDRTVEFSAL